MFKYRRPASSAVASSDSLSPLLDQAGVTCWAVAAIIGVAVLVLLMLLAYQRYIMGKKPTQHLCDYCGHMVAAVSDCHHAPVKERFLHGTCTECRNDCRLVCARCKRPL